jgi:Phytanoyl-CoA dioxygenase (PhyH)
MTEVIPQIINIAPNWAGVKENIQKIESLTSEKKEALKRLLQAEKMGITFAAERDRYVDDLCAFDLSLNTIIGSILEERTSSQALYQADLPSVFERDAKKEGTELQAMNKNGYVISALRLSQDQQKAVLDDIAKCSFVNRGIFPIELSGTKLMRCIADESISKYIGVNGDTFWAKDLDQLVQQEHLRKLAFDPYFLSIAGAYLGCVPIHVQTNAWFSFPTFNETNNLSTNAQMFHQDKEFAKFFKVFIYLTDVTEDNGPHVFIEGSHIDEAHTLGVPITDRIPDLDITKYYAAERIKTLLGPAGTITFADTSGVHKSLTVRSGYRLMLQLEYASSLYLSPVAPFSAPVEAVPELTVYPEPLRARVMANYSDVERQAHADRVAGQTSAEYSGLRKVLQLIKRYLRGHKAGI